MFMTMVFFLGYEMLKYMFNLRLSIKNKEKHK